MGTAPTEFIEVIKLRFGAPVVASDGASGIVAHVVVDSDTRTITHVGVKVARLARHSYSIPLAVVKDAESEGVELTITRDAIPHDAQPIPVTSATLTSSTHVDVRGKRMGRLTQISAARDTGALLRLVVERGLGRGEVLVPVDATTKVDARHIDAQLNETQIKSLIDYRPDADVLQDAYDALYDYPRLRVDLQGIHLRAVDGQLWLTGHVSSDLNSRLVVDQLQGIDGLGSIHNELVADTDLAAAVGMALSQDPRTHGEHIGVYPMLGEVRLRGAVKTAEARRVASEIAEAVPGVERVTNELDVKPDADVVPIFASVTGQEDLVPGGA